MASLTFTDADGTWKLHNGKPFPADRFASWTPDSIPVGQSAHRQSDGALTMFRFRTDFGVSFELPYIPSVRSTNLLLRPEEFDNAAWSKSNITVTPNATTAPDGSATGDKIEATAAAATTVTQSAAVAATACTYSIYGKRGSGVAGDANRFGIRNATTATDLLFVTIDWSTGAITYTVGAAGASVVPDGAWFRIIMSVAAGIVSGNSITCYGAFNGGVETAGEFSYLWGAQLQPGLIATPYLYTEGAARSGVSMVEIADRLKYHLLNGGTCSVYTNDAAASSYATCGLKPGTTPQITLADRRTLEYTLSLQLINVAGSPARMLARYAEQ